MDPTDATKNAYQSPKLFLDFLRAIGPDTSAESATTNTFSWSFVSKMSSFQPDISEVAKWEQILLDGDRLQTFLGGYLSTEELLTSMPAKRYVLSVERLAGQSLVRKTHTKQLQRMDAAFENILRGLTNPAKMPSSAR
eukprot:GHVU01219548.1.p1 GENE.GHVU01219548.1~~GHVU01219548.1.p1  ORF type:complete len:138 (+),score=13.86 GHVU01219548.1:380-793(+)